MSTMVKADATGAVTLPAELCQAAGVAPGADLVAEVQVGRIVIERPRQPIWERIAARAAETPPEEMDKLPADGAAQIDHYLYGHPKRKADRIMCESLLISHFRRFSHDTHP